MSASFFSSGGNASLLGSGGGSNGLGAWGGGAERSHTYAALGVTTRATATGGLGCGATAMGQWLTLRCWDPRSLPSPQLSSTFWVKAAKQKANVTLPVQKLLLRLRKWRISAARGQAAQRDISTATRQLIKSFKFNDSKRLEHKHGAVD